MIKPVKLIAVASSLMLLFASCSGPIVTEVPSASLTGQPEVTLSEIIANPQAGWSIETVRKAAEVEGKKDAIQAETYNHPSAQSENLSGQDVLTCFLFCSTAAAAQCAWLAVIPELAAVCAASRYLSCSANCQN